MASFEFIPNNKHRNKVRVIEEEREKYNKCDGKLDTLC